MLDHFNQLFVYHNWANARVLDAIASLDGDSDAHLRLFAHCIAAARLWLMRINGKNLTGPQVWPTLSLDECRTMAAEEEQSWGEFLAGLDVNALARRIDYTNSVGQTFTNTIQEILTHAFNHATYHRGQIAMKIRESGGTPPSTDYIVFVRE